MSKQESKKILADFLEQLKTINYSEISDIKKLVSYHKKSSGIAEKRKLIEARILEVSGKMSNYDILSYCKNLSNVTIGILFIPRINELLKETSSVKDIDTYYYMALKEFKVKKVFTIFHTIIGNRMEEIIKQAIDVEEFYSWISESHWYHPKVRETVRVQFEKVLKSVSDIEKLFYYFHTIRNTYDTEWKATTVIWDHLEKSLSSTRCADLECSTLLEIFYRSSEKTRAFLQPFLVKALAMTPLHTLYKYRTGAFFKEFSGRKFKELKGTSSQNEDAMLRIKELIIPAMNKELQSILSTISTLKEIREKLHFLTVTSNGWDLGYIKDEAVNDRIKEILKGISDVGQLIQLWSEHSNINHYIESRLVEVLTKVLPSISDMSVLIGYNKNTSYSWSNSFNSGYVRALNAHQLIEKRGLEIIKEISDVPLLIKYSRNSITPLRKIIEDRIVELIKQTSSIEMLLHYFNIGSDFDEQIEIVLRGRLRGSPEKNLEPTLLEIAKNKTTIPKIFIPIFQRKIKRLLNS